ncbi:MAG: hypothetical protein JWM28_1015 [Chitinophagaceae bacterium]|nr:hypothetical protein [Chitinophagaceae bacterium]
MKKISAIPLLVLVIIYSCSAQETTMSAAAGNFIKLLDKKQKAKAMYSFDSSERYNWHFVPLDDRKGIEMNSLDEKQKAAAIQLFKTGLSEEGYAKATAIMQLELVLKVLEKHADSDHFRDPGKYFITIFGLPSSTGIWGWRLEGHHISFNFSADSNKLVSGTPGFFGSNPAIVLSGPQKGTQVLKKEEEIAFELLHSLTAEQLQKTSVDTVAPAEIITFASRKAIIENPRGLSYTAMTEKQQQIFMQLLSVYIHRYTKLFADDMMKEIAAAGMDQLLFAWAGSHEKIPGHPNYYRIQGPTIIIEYDNSQNNANHVHTVVRDLKRDFGGDELLEHYKKGH